MLKKLLKHEWIATGRRYGLFYLVLAAVTLFTALIRMIEVDSVAITVIQGLLTGIYVITLIGVWFCSIGLAVVRFYKNMVTDEGYLTFTLPVKVEQLVSAKLIIALVWQVITVVAIAFSLVSVFLLGNASREQVTTVIEMLEAEVGLPLPMFAAVLFVSMVYQMLVYYLSIAVGQMFSGNKIAGSIIGYLVISFGIEFVMIVIVFLCGFLAGFGQLDSFMTTEGGMSIFVCLMCGIMLGVAVVEFFITCYLLKKKLNLN